MDTAQAVTLITGSGGAMIVMFLWIKSLQAEMARLVKALEDKDERNETLTVTVTSLATDVQRSLNEQSGCRFNLEHVRMCRPADGLPKHLDS